MVEVVVGVALTAVLGGLLVPLVKGRIDRRGEQYLDQEIDRCRAAATTDDWRDLHRRLIREKRAEIDELLATVTDDLRLYGRRPT